MRSCYSRGVNFQLSKMKSSRDLLYNIVPILTILPCTLKNFVKRVDLMLCVLTTITKQCIVKCFVLDWHLIVFYNFLKQYLKHQNYLSLTKKKKKAITGQVFITFLSLLLHIIELCSQCYRSVQCSHYTWLLNESCQA